MAFDQDQIFYKLPVNQFNFNSLKEVYIPAIQQLFEGHFDLEKIFEPKQIMMKMHTLEPTISNNMMRLTALYVDSYGNVFFNLTKSAFEEFTEGKPFAIKFYSFKIERILNDYDDVPEGEILALFSYGNLLQIAGNASNASIKLGLQEDSMILLEAYK
jgi:S-adenosylmethionine hydrolase